MNNHAFFVVHAGALHSDDEDEEGKGRKFVLACGGWGGRGEGEEKKKSKIADERRKSDDHEALNFFVNGERDLRS